MKKVIIERETPENLLKILQEEKIYLPAYCNGRGTCGKCRVRFVENAPAHCEEDEKFFSKEELLEGWRLACRSIVQGRIALEVEDYNDENIEAVSDFSLKNTDDNSGEQEQPEDGTVKKEAAEKGSRKKEAGEANAGFKENTREIIAVDIGTTTIAAAHLDGKTGEAVKIKTMVNHQRAYGGDVISRINASVNGKKEVLQQSIEKDLKEITELLDVPLEKARLIISANTTMQHLLQGYPCDTLGVSPYKPYDISLHEYKNMVILPGISTYVGADIVSGIIACEMDRREDISILVDLGTNGEMAIGNKDRILAASTAAGPAFEGGNISCGMAGVPGAISSVEINGTQIAYETIGNMPPAGLCGTGVLETVYELLKNEHIDETGMMAEEYLEDGFPVTDMISFAAKDVREIQLAKSAIRAGLEILIKEFGADYKDIAHVFIAGGFGQKVNIKKAVGIGLFPEELEDKIQAVGNSSLAGAFLFAKNEELSDRFCRVASGAREISLAMHPDFNDLYIEYMFFDEE